MLTRILSRTLIQFRLFSSEAIKVQLPPVDVHILNKDELPKVAETNRDELLKYYRMMALERRFEGKADECYKNGEIRGFCHLMDGQEACSVGILAAMDDHDHMITAYRYHGTVVARGCPPEKAFAELFGKSTGVGHGKGGSMHMTMRDKNFYGGHGIVGAQVPLGTGLAFGIKYEGKKEVSITMFGDGAINQGQVAEAANMAKLWDLPVIYVCENNLYGMGTPYDKASSNPLLYTKLHPIPGIRLDGQNVLAVREHMRFARNWCVSGKGPIMLELMTYRFHGHSVSDSGLGYRTRQEVEKMRRERDPITLLKNLILERGAGTEEELKAIEKEIKQLIEKAAETARNDPMPDPQKDLFTDIHGTPYDDMFIRHTEFDNSVFPKGYCRNKM